MSAPILRPEQRWECPACDLTDVTHEARPISRMHDCPGVKGLSVPMVAAGTKAKHVINKREDYAFGQILARDGDGRVVMSVSTVRDEGQDCTVYAPTATGEAREL